MRILVTGGAGFIGSHVDHRLLERGHEVAIVDNLSTGKRENVPQKARFYEMDIRSGCPEVFEEFRPQVLSHQAAQMDVRHSIREPDFDADVNVLGTSRLFQNCVEHGVRRVVFASTGGAIYGEQRKFPVPEDHLQCPISPYGVSKLARYRRGDERQPPLRAITADFRESSPPNTAPLSQANSSAAPWTPPVPDACWVGGRP